MLLTSVALAQKPLTTQEAKIHVGEQATVCGKAASIRYDQSSRGSPTFINLDKPYPNQVFTVVIWGEDRSKFGNPEMGYRDKRLCITGTISLYREVPEIKAREPGQIKVSGD